MKNTNSNKPDFTNAKQYDECWSAFFGKTKIDRINEYAMHISKIHNILTDTSRYRVCVNAKLDGTVYTDDDHPTIFQSFQQFMAYWNEEYQKIKECLTMSRLKDRTGIDETCPLINSVIEIVKESYSSEQHISFSELKDAESYLEDIRQANGALRELAIESMSKIEDLESDVNYWKEKFEVLEDILKDIEKAKE